MFIGGGGKPSAQFIDSFYPDNTGYLVVTIT
jgi:hypothetical protein